MVAQSPRVAGSAWVHASSPVQAWVGSVVEEGSQEDIGVLRGQAQDACEHITTTNDLKHSNTPVQHPFILDATRTSTKEIVVLKKVVKSRHPHEVEISQYFSSEALRSDRRNHCVPVLDVLNVPDDPDINIIVFPLLRNCNDPDWATVGELVSFLVQIFEVNISLVSDNLALLSNNYSEQGLQFMHQEHTPHR